MKSSAVHRAAIALAVLSLSACGGSGSQGGGGAAKDGPVVARGNGVTITSEEFKARLDEQSPFVRSRFAELESKKQFLDNLVRFELLANEAQKQGLDKDPEVQLMMKRVMVQKLVQRRFSDEDLGKDVPEAELRQYYDAHKDEYQRSGRVRLAQVLFAAKEGSPERAAKEAAAKAALARIRAEEKKNPAAFQAAARELSDDASTKSLGGDLGFRTTEELATQFSKPVADAAFALQQDQVSDVVASPLGFHILKRTAFQEAVNRPFDQVKPQIAAKLARERRSKAFDDEVARLRKEANVVVDEGELAKVEVNAGSPAAGMGGTGGTGGPPRGPSGVSGPPRGPSAPGGPPHGEAPVPNPPTPADAAASGAK
jgi:peptidyl-prolyl cis-trans isomerase C